MAKVVEEGAGRFNHHYPRVAAIVTAQANGRDNAMAVAWHSSISLEPPLYGVSISPKRFTYQLITDSKEFGVNFLFSESTELIAQIGGSSGHNIDKFQKLGIAKSEPVKTRVPILESAYAAYECKLIDDTAYGDHQWLVGEIVAVHMMEEAFTPEGVLDVNQVSPILYLGRDRYLIITVDRLRHLDRRVYGKL